MAYTTIDKPTDYFNTKLYTGTGSSHAVSGIGFQPDWVWIKCRDDTHNHQVFDSVRGVHKRMRTDTSGAETESSESLKSFDSDGFTLGTQANVNNPSNTFVSWNWKAGGTASSNTDGSITTTVSANQTSGFSIIKYAGNSTNSTIGHGLGAEPEYIIFKETDGGESWRVWSKYTPNTSSVALALNLTNAAFSQTGWISGVSTSTISIGTDSSINTSGNNYICYAFAPKKGYSKFGIFVGNANLNGTFVYTGFKPAFLIVRNADATADWVMNDNKRNTFNPNSNMLFANTSGDENTGTARSDFLSNGFKIRSSNSDWNGNGNKMLYMAFAKNPFVTSTGIPTTAR